MKMLTALLLLLPVLASADAYDSWQKLEREPATLIDIGVLKASIEMQEFDSTINSAWRPTDENDKETISRIGYDDSKNILRLEIEVYFTTDPKRECAFLLGEYGKRVFAGLAAWFSHETMMTSEQYSAIRNALNQRVELNCSAGEDNELTIHGKRMLLDKEIYWKGTGDN